MILLALNLVLALTLGDFGASLRRYEIARSGWKSVGRSASASVPERRASEQGYLQATAELNEQRKRFWPHIWLGIAATLVGLLVNCISVTYFIGTNRWCREVVEAYEMDASWIQKSLSLKRRTFPWALAGIVMILLILVLGAASDVYSPVVSNPAAWVHWHMAAAMLGLVVIGVSFHIQANAVAANYRVINEIVQEANRLRGLAEG